MSASWDSGADRCLPWRVPPRTARVEPPRWPVPTGRSQGGVDQVVMWRLRVVRGRSPLQTYPRPSCSWPGYGAPEVTSDGARERAALSRMPCRDRPRGGRCSSGPTAHGQRSDRFRAPFRHDRPPRRAHRPVRGTSGTGTPTSMSTRRGHRPVQNADHVVSPPIRGGAPPCCCPSERARTPPYRGRMRCRPLEPRPLASGALSLPRVVPPPLARSQRR